MKFDIKKDWDLATMGILAVTTAFGFGNQVLSHGNQMYIFSGVTLYHLWVRHFSK